MEEATAMAQESSESTPGWWCVPSAESNPWIQSENWFASLGMVFSFQAFFASRNLVNSGIRFLIVRSPK